MYEAFPRQIGPILASFAISLLCFCSLLVAALGQSPPQEALPTPSAAPAQPYAGTNQCFQCHRPQTNSWSATRHAHAYTDLPQPYQSNAACLKCHVTGFGQPSGFVAGGDKDLLMVGCETCHGPGRSTSTRRSGSF